MKETLRFLRDLQLNNNRPWFNAHKEQYLHVLEKWNDFSMKLLAEVAKFDPTVEGLTLQDITYRIYRDTRFSADKTPYKTHFGTYIARGGKRSPYAGYYFHVGVGGDADYTPGHMLAMGNYYYDKRVMQVLREDVSYGWDEFRRTVLGAADPHFQPMQDGALKRVPRGFSADDPAAEWLRLRMFGVWMPVDDNFLFEKDLPARAAALFATTKPLADFINRAIDYARDEGNNTAS